MFEGRERSERDGILTIDYARESIDRDGIYPRIHGMTDGKPYTLED
nr:hypothetical protein [Herbidospora daliensis]